MFTVSVIQDFSAAHRLKGHKGKCERLHGHNWKVEVHVQSDRLDELGMVKDFGDLKAITSEALSDLDHSDLNALEAFQDRNPSAENLARYIYGKLKGAVRGTALRIQKVVVWESETTAAAYEDLQE